MFYHRWEPIKVAINIPYQEPEPIQQFQLLILQLQLHRPIGKVLIDVSRW
jgi:hypothetical protein